MDVGRPARGQPRRLATPAHRNPGTQRWPARARSPRRPGHDRHPAAPTDPRPRPPRSPRGCADPAPATRPDPARRDPGPYPRPSGNVLTTGRLGLEPPGTTPTRGENRAVMLPDTPKQPLQDL